MPNIHKIDDILNVTSIQKESDETLAKPNNSNVIMEGLTNDNKVHFDEDTVQSCAKENADRIDNFNESMQNKHCSTGDIMKLENNEFSSIANSTRNHIHKITNSTKHNDTWSYTQEFEFFLKKYKDNYDNCNTIGPLSGNICAKEEFMNDITEHESLENRSESNLYGNFETDFSARAMDEIDENLRNTVKDDIYKINDAAKFVVSEIELVKAINPSLINYDSDLLHHLNDVVTKDNAIIENIISNDSESSDISIDTIHLNPSVNYSMSPLNNIKLDFNDEFEFDSDCEGYNSSDFEFIDEKEACLRGVVDKSEAINENLIHNNCIINEYREEFYKPGPSKLTDNQVESNIPLSKFNSRTNSESDIEELNKNHIIPEGENLHQLFAEPWAAFNYEVENKSLISNGAMYLDVNNFGFNVEILHQRHQENDIDDAVKEEAIENARMILKMYPVENRKRGHRF